MFEKNVILVILGVLGMSTICTYSAAISGTALFCRDPDTGKLHAVNTTWVATSFCGNYTCSMRRRNITLNATNPIREFNVTSVPAHRENKTDDEIPLITVSEKTELGIQPLLHKNQMPDPNYEIKNLSEVKHTEIADANKVIKNEEFKPKKHNCHIIIKRPLPKEDDEYLTEKEIDNIADMLHTIKRSDLNAVVDVYNLAQDIYKEIDEITDEEIKTEALNIIKDEQMLKNKTQPPVSYWYELLANKVKIDDNDKHYHQRFNDIIYSTNNPVTVNKNKFVPSSLNRAVSNTGNEEKMPPNYPVTRFQRIFSYTHPSYELTTQKYESNNMRTMNNNPKINAMMINNKPISNSHPKLNTLENNSPSSKRLIQPSLYLPYPFATVHQYNNTDNRNFYISPWVLQYYNKYKYYQPFYTPYMTQVGKAPMFEPKNNKKLRETEQNITNQVLQQKSIEKDLMESWLNGKKTPDWKTEPINSEVLKDIRADIEASKTRKLFPLRKKIKIEKVSKVVNIDSLLEQQYRNKRFASNILNNNTERVDEFEPFLEKVTCNEQIGLGYFRMGNLTQPYPKCCPQLIDTR